MDSRITIHEDGAAGQTFIGVSSGSVQLPLLSLNDEVIVTSSLRCLEGLGGITMTANVNNAVAVDLAQVAAHVGGPENIDGGVYRMKSGGTPRLSFSFSNRSPLLGDEQYGDISYRIVRKPNLVAKAPQPQQNGDVFLPYIITGDSPVTYSGRTEGELYYASGATKDKIIGERLGGGTLKSDPNDPNSPYLIKVPAAALDARSIPQGTTHLLFWIDKLGFANESTASDNVASFALPDFAVKTILRREDGGVDITYRTGPARVVSGDRIGLQLSYATGKTPDTIVGSPLGTAFGLSFDPNTVGSKKIASDALHSLPQPPSQAKFLIAHVKNTTGVLRETDYSNNFFSVPLNSFLPDYQALTLKPMNSGMVRLSYNIIGAPTPKPEVPEIALVWAQEITLPNGSKSIEKLAGTLPLAGPRTFSTTRQTYTLDFPVNYAAAPRGATHVLALIDYDRNVAESSEANNAASFELTHYITATGTITAYRPQTPYFDPQRVSPRIARSTGAGIRIDSNPAGPPTPQNLLRVDLKLPFNDNITDNLDYELRRDNESIRVWSSAEGGSLILNSDRASIAVSGENPSVWVQWAGTTQGKSTLKLYARNVDTDESRLLDTVKFYTFRSDVIILSGERFLGGTPTDSGMFAVAQELINDGYDVHLFTPHADLRDFGFRLGQTAAIAEVVDAVMNRGVRDFALLGHSHGGGAVYNVALALDDMNVEIDYAAYVDAVEIDSIADISPEARFPPGTAFVRNFYQDLSSLQGVAVPGAKNVYVTGEKWGATRDHNSIMTEVKHVQATLIADVNRRLGREWRKVGRDLQVQTARNAVAGIDVSADLIQPDLAALTVAEIIEPLHGTVTVQGGVLAYTPAPDFVGSDFFYYSLGDLEGTYGTHRVDVSVLPPPNAPTNLRIVATRPGEADLSWNEVEGETSYTIQVSTDGGATWRKSEDTPADHAYKATVAAQRGSDNWFRVVANNQFGVSEPSNTVRVMATESPPQAPTNLRVANRWARTIDLNWDDKSNNETEFRVAISRDGGATWDNVGVMAPNATSLRVENLQPRTRYLFKMRAANESGYSDYTSPVEVVTRDEIPAAPSNLRVANTWARTIDLNWDDKSNNETEFRIAISRDGGATWDNVGVSAANATSVRVESLQPETRYLFKVRAANDEGYSGYSQTVDVITRSEVPVAPANLRAATVWARTIDLKWDDRSGNETEFRLAISRDGGATWDNVGAKDANLTSLRVEGLLPNTRYLFKTRAGNAAGYSDYTPVLEVITKDEAPAAAANLRTANIWAQTIDLNWDDRSGNESGFIILLSLDGGRFTEIGRTGANATSFRATGLKANTRYVFQVVAFNAVGSNLSNLLDTRTKK